MKAAYDIEPLTLVTSAMVEDVYFNPKFAYWIGGYNEQDVDHFTDRVEETLDYYEKMRDSLVEILLPLEGKGQAKVNTKIQEALAVLNRPMKEVVSGKEASS